MVSSIRTIYTGMAVAGLFVFVMISFIVQFELDNLDGGAEETILNNSIINSTFNRLNSNLSALGQDTQTQRGVFESEIPERGFGSLLIFSIVSVTQKFNALIVGVYNILVILPASILGIPAVLFSVISSILIVTIVLLLWRVVRVGS